MNTGKGALCLILTLIFEDDAYRVTVISKTNISCFQGVVFIHESTGEVALSRRLENKTWPNRRNLISVFPNSLKVGELTRAS